MDAARRGRGDRRGKVVVMFALLLPVLVGGMALSVDSGVIGTGKAQLQAMTDGAALAGAMQLVSESRVRGSTNLTTEIAAARSQAQAIAAAHRILGDAPGLSVSSSSPGDGDIRIGYLDPESPTATLNSSSGLTSRFNSVQVFGTRVNGQGGPIPSYFGRVLGFTSGTGLTVSSTATVEVWTIRGFQTISGQNPHLLPIVEEKTIYDAMMAGLTTDEYSYNPTTGAVTAGSDGVTESRLYPVRTGNPGNWGTVKIGVSNNSTSVLGAQIRYGITPAQLATFPGGVIELDPVTGTLILPGNPGISAGIKDDLTSIIGKPVTVPIYDQSGGNGNNAWFRIVAFAPVRIMSVNFQGNPKYVIIQPALTHDPTAIGGSRLNTWTKGGLVRLHLSR